MRWWRRVALVGCALVGLGAPGAVVAKSFLPVPGAARVPAVGTNTVACGRPTLRPGDVARVAPAPVAFAEVPGKVLSATLRSSVEGFDPEPHTSSIGFVTVHVVRVANWLALDIAKRDCDADLFSREQMLGTATAAQDASASRNYMSASKDVSAYVVFRRLGFDVEVTGGGIVVASVCADGPDNACRRYAPAAELLGPGDVITSVAGRRVHLVDDIAAALVGRAAGERVVVEALRGTETRRGEVELVAGENGRVALGVVPEILLPASTTFDFSHRVDIDDGGVSGSSGGLAFALALLDAMTEGDLTGGRLIVATGELNAVGRVGTVAGVHQKAVAAAEAGADLMLVPEREVAEARRGAGAMKVVGVRTLDDALAAIAAVTGASVPLVPRQPTEGATAAPVPEPTVTTVSPPSSSPATSSAPVSSAPVSAVPELPVYPLGEHCWPLGATARTPAGAVIMCSRVDAQGIPFDDAMARWRRT